MGRAVSTLVKGVKAPGLYSIQWRGIDKNGTPLPSGVYFLRMKAGGFEDNQKMLIAR